MFIPIAIQNWRDGHEAVVPNHWRGFNANGSMNGRDSLRSERIRFEMVAHQLIAERLCGVQPR